MNPPSFNYCLLSPKYWTTWLGFGIWWLLAQLPYSLQMRMGSLLGRLMPLIAKRRIAIAKRNLELCFPHLTKNEQKKLLEQHIDSLGKVFFEMGIAWFWSRKRLARLVTIEGLEYLKEAEAKAKGVVLMTVHFSHMQLAITFLNIFHSIDCTYKRHTNPVHDFIQNNRHKRFNQNTTGIERKNMRLMVKSLRQGRAVWYAPDQDYGIKHSIFLPFFGVNAACITATSPLTQTGNASLISVCAIRKSEGGYRLIISPPLENFPTENLIKDTQLIVSTIEKMIILAPEQYLWVHRRFKNQPEGAPDLYAADLLRQAK
jgi:Kdo2-lipid IVA lauroyltransferase/acyltransferase